jgi:hypothetical protein
MKHLQNIDPKLACWHGGFNIRLFLVNIFKNPKCWLLEDRQLI